MSIDAFIQATNKRLTLLSNSESYIDQWFVISHPHPTPPHPSPPRPPSMVITTDLPDIK